MQSFKYTFAIMDAFSAQSPPIDNTQNNLLEQIFEALMILKYKKLDDLFFFVCIYLSVSCIDLWPGQMAVIMNHCDNPRKQLLPVKCTLANLLICRCLLPICKTNRRNWSI